MSESVVDSAKRLIADRLGEVGFTPTYEAARRRVRQPRAYDAHAASAACVCKVGKRCVVQQQYGDEVDINTIVRRFGMVQTTPHARPGGVYGDFTGITDFESAVAVIDRAREGFNVLPAEVREKFGNDPGRFYAETGNMTAEQLDELVPKVEAVKAATMDDVVAAVRALRAPVEGDSPPAV